MSDHSCPYTDEVSVKQETRSPGMGGRGTCSMHEGGSDGASYSEPKQIHEPEIFHPQKITWHQNFLPKKIQDLPHQY